MNSNSRYYLPSADWKAKQLVLSGDEAHHAVRVLREKAGNIIEVFDGKGQAAEAKVISISKSEVQLEVLNLLSFDKPKCQIELCQSIPKGSNMEWIIQKSVELGVSSIQPLLTQNTISRAEQLEKKKLKWQRTAIEACKQCGQNVVPEVKEPLLFKEWMSSNIELKGDLKIVAALDNRALPIKEILSQSGVKQHTASLLIGPEGDFSDDEYNALHDAEFSFASIGEIVLKVETAAIFCISILQYELNG